MEETFVKRTLGVLAWAWVGIGSLGIYGGARGLLDQGFAEGTYNAVFVLFGLLVVWSALALKEARPWARYALGTCVCVSAAYFSCLLFLGLGVALWAKLAIGGGGLLLSVCTLVLLPALREHV